MLECDIMERLLLLIRMRPRSWDVGMDASRVKDKPIRGVEVKGL